MTKIEADPIAAALETAQLIASKNPQAIRAAKAIINEAPYVSEADALLRESELQEEIIV